MNKDHHKIRAVHPWHLELPGILLAFSPSTPEDPRGRQYPEPLSQLGVVYTGTAASLHQNPDNTTKYSSSSSKRLQLG